MEALYETDAYLREFSADVTGVEEGRRAVALSASAFFPGGGGQPHDVGRLEFNGTRAEVTAASKGDGGVVWHELADGAPLPAVGVEVRGVLDWERRHRTMRTHTALHILNGLIWVHHGARVTGAHMTPGEGRLDFELPEMSKEFGREIEARINDQVARSRRVKVRFMPRSEADLDPSLIRLKANLIPRTIDPLRVIDIVGLDRQADGGTHVASTGEVGRVLVTGTQSKGRANKRVRIALADE
ncbi:MAG TPA: alanyl-tRNA editing protein [Thermoleophilaceae bacterium]|jgi:misacylated tRNA(Ala) deacylase